MEVEADIGVEAIMEEEPMLGIIDIILIIILFGLGAWWLLKDRKKPELAQTKSYSIQ